MTLKFEGTVLAVNTKLVSSRDGSYADYNATTIVCLDEGDVTEIRTGRDFPPSDVARLKADAGSQPRVTLDVFASQKGNLFANRLLEVVPTTAATSKTS